MALVKYNNNSISAVTSASSIPSGALTHIKTLTASSSGTLSFVDGSSDVVLDSTYPIYVFKFISLHPATDNVLFQFNMSVDSGSNYNVSKTTTHFTSLHNESGSAASISYKTGLDQSTSTSFKTLVEEVGGDNDQNCCGELFLFNISSTTFVKHFLARINNTRRSNYSADHYSAGYGSTTSAVDAVQFKMSSGNIDAGTIKLYGIKDS